MGQAPAGKRTISFFGGAAIQADGVPIGGRAAHRHPLALLALLVVNGGKPMTRDKLIALLWPERSAEGARNLLKVNVHELRKELGDTAIRSTGDQLSADLSVLECDVSLFLAASAKGDDRAAAALYTGPFLDGFYIKDAAELEHWADAERVRLAGLYAGVLERLGAAAESAGDHEAAVRWRRAHAVHEPYRPDVAHRLMQALAASGDREGAIRFAESFAERQRIDLEISDDHGIVTLARRLPSAFTPVASTGAVSAPMRDLIPTLPEIGRPPRRRSMVAIAAVATLVGVGLLSTAAMALRHASGAPADRGAALTNRPAEAVRDYAAGERAYRAAHYATAESLYARALEADSTFGAAGLGLALANSWTGINEHYGIGRDAAIKYRDALSRRDRAFVAAFFGPDPALGPPQPAPVYLTGWEDVVEKWPDWTEAWYQLGDRYYHFGGLSGLADPGDRARTAFRRALSQDSSFAAPLHHLTELYAGRHETAALRDAAARYFAANPAVDRDRSAIGWEVATALGDSAWLRRVRANFDTMPREDLTRIGWVTDANGWPRADADRAASIAEHRSTVTSEHEKSLILLFTLSENAGDTPGAVHAAAGLGALFPGAPVGALWELYAGLFGDGDRPLAAGAAARLAAFARVPASGDHVRRDQHHQAACLSGYWSALQGDLAAARAADVRVRADLRTEDNKFVRRNADVCLAMLAATIAERSHAADARLLVARLDTILLRERVPPHAILEAGTIVAAQLHAALGDTAAALVAARRREHLTGDPLFLSTQLREEALYADATGDHDGAARAVAHFKALRGGSK
ncbi:MAG: transcriptional activator protein [Gemmatimonadetes bacterium]|nr:transcriptional activator protein [Gemmatimonadota bacterium]